MVASMAAAWSVLSDEGRVRGTMDRASLVDVVAFVAMADKVRRSSQKRWGNQTLEMVETLVNSMALFLASCVRAEALRICDAVADIDSRSIPSRRILKSPPASSPPDRPNSSLVPFDPLNEDDGGAERPATRSRTSKVMLDLNSIWELYTDSLSMGVSLPTLARTRRKDRRAGASEASTLYWTRKIENIYGRRSGMSMSGCQYFSVACDASRHSCRDTLVSCVWSPENQVACYANSQVLKSGGTMLAPGEALLDDEVEELAATRQIERLASYRLMQAVSYQLKFLTGKTFSTFMLDETDPLALALAPLSSDVVRVLKQDNVFVHNKATRETKQLDLSGARSKPVLSLIMDQGPCGCAFAGFLAGSDRCLIHYSFLVLLVGCAYVDSDLFSEYAVLISMDFKQQIRTAEDFRDLWSSLASELESFRLKKSLVKSGRWFSWHTAAEEHMNEWHALQMLLRHQFPDMEHPDKMDKKSFKDLRSDSGGLKLALKCTTFQNWLGVQVLMLGGRPMWNWWSKTIREIKSPEDGLRNFITMSSTWRSDLQFQELVECLQNVVEIKRVAQYCTVLGRSPEDFAKQLWYYVVGLLCHRVGSLSKHECAPYCFAPLLGPEGVLSHAAGEMMLADWKTLCILEQAASAGAADLAMEMRNCIYPPMRLAFTLLETGDKPGALQLLRAMLQTFPDTKLIEDCHQRIRCDSLQNPNQRHTTSEIQNIVIGSQVLELRGISHPAALTKQAFMSRWKSTKATKMRSKFHCANEKLPTQFGKIMGKKTWPTLSPESLIRAAGAWMWAREYFTKSLKRSNVALTVSRHFCQFVFEEVPPNNGVS
eukprot:s1285_g5.t1